MGVRLMSTFPSKFLGLALNTRVPQAWHLTLLPRRRQFRRRLLFHHPRLSNRRRSGTKSYGVL